MKILLFGKNGQLGWEIQQLLAASATSYGVEQYIALDYPEVDFTHPKSVRMALSNMKEGDVLINAAAYTAVDQAESERELAFAVNRDAPALIAEEAKRIGAFFIHFSTDYVFDGTKNAPYVETDVPHPLSIYGNSKMMGEQAVQAIGGNFIILRTSWVYSLRGDTFVNKVLRWARSQTVLRVVDDQISNPTYAKALASATLMLLQKARQHSFEWLKEHRGLYHLAGSGYTSRYEWALEILKLDPLKEEHIVNQVLPAKTADFRTSALRPLFSALSCQLFTETFGFQLPPWQESLQKALLGE